MSSPRKADPNLKSIRGVWRNTIDDAKRARILRAYAEREEDGLTVKDIARRFGVDAATIHCLVRGGR